MIIPEKAGLFSQMPYLHDAGGSVSMLFCLSDSLIKQKDGPDYRPWRIHSYDLATRSISRIRIPSKEGEVEDSPVCYYRDGKFTLSFLLGRYAKVGSVMDYVDLNLYKMEGKSLNDLGKMEPVVPFRVLAGFYWYDKAVFSLGDGRIMHDNIDGPGRYDVDTGLDVIIRMVPKHDHTTTVLVAGYRGSYDLATLLYDLDARKVIGELKPDDKGPFNPSLFENMMARVVVVGDYQREEYKVDLLKDIGSDPSNLVLR